jgi:hypothetical protein
LVAKAYSQFPPDLDASAIRHISLIGQEETGPAEAGPAWTTIGSRAVMTASKPMRDRRPLINAEGTFGDYSYLNHVRKSVFVSSVVLGTLTHNLLSLI